MFNDSSLPIRPGSPLTAVAMSDLNNLTDPTVNKLHLYFTTRTNSVIEIVTSVPDLLVWKVGTLGPHMNYSLSIGRRSQLASTWRRCRDETACGLGQFFLIYETDDQHIIVANSTSSWDPSPVISHADLNSTGIALMSVQALDIEPLNMSDYAWAIYEDGSRLTTAVSSFYLSSLCLEFRFSIQRLFGNIKVPDDSQPLSTVCKERLLIIYMFQWQNYKYQNTTWEWTNKGMYSHNPLSNPN